MVLPLMTLSRPARASSLLILVLSITGGCAPEEPDSGPAEEPESQAAPTGEGQARPGGGAGDDPASGDSAVRVALPGLFSIMVGLQGDMARVSRGLWLENFDTIGAGADAVADHPRVPQEEFQRISEILGSDMTRFGAMDQEVHDLAVELSDAAGRGALEEVLAIEAELRQGCVSCHSAFRERLRESLTTQPARR